MKAIKLTTILAAVGFVLFALGCELEDEAADGTTGTTDTAGGADTGVMDPCPSCSMVGSFDSTGDDVCTETSFYDTDCVGMPADTWSYQCGKSQCDFTEGICEAMQPCGAVQKLMIGDVHYLVARPCPYDPDCVPFAGDEPAFACDDDGHCDTWCPVHNGVSIDPNCTGNTDAGAYCPGGVKYDRCD